MKPKILYTPFTPQVLSELSAGIPVYLNGIAYTARDAAHKRFIKKIPFDIKGALIYYSGMIVKQRKILSAGPTTSKRMDPFTKNLLRMGLGGMLGKGPRSQYITELIKKYNAVYFVTVGGAGAFLARHIKLLDIVAWEDLGPEAVYKIELCNFPAWVGIDTKGKTIWNKRW